MVKGEKEMTRQYRYSNKYDPSILKTKTVNNIMSLVVFLINNVSITEKHNLPKMKDFRKLTKDFRHAKSSIGKIGNWGKK